MFGSWEETTVRMRGRDTIMLHESLRAHGMNTRRTKEKACRTISQKFQIATQFPSNANVTCQRGVCQQSPVSPRCQSVVSSARMELDFCKCFVRRALHYNQHSSWTNSRFRQLQCPHAGLQSIFVVSQSPAACFSLLHCVVKLGC